MQLLNHVTADTTSEPFKHFGGASGLMNLYVSGDLAEGKLLLEAETPDESTYVKVAEITEPGMHVISAAPFVGQITLAGVTTTADLSVWVEGESIKLTQRVREDD